MEVEENDVFDFSQRPFFSYLVESASNYMKTAFDLKLSVSGNEIRCHKSLICQESEFFQLMFTTDMMEKAQDTISLKDVSYNACKSVIDFLYSCELVVPSNEMCEIVRLVDMFQLHILRPVCAEILLNSCSVGNLISVNCLASQYRYHDVADEAFALILQHFCELTSEADFLDASYELVLKIFKSECLFCINENECIRAILNWIQFDINSRHVHVVDLLETIIADAVSCWNELESRSYMFELHPTAFHVFNNWIAKGKKQANDFRSDMSRMRGQLIRKICVAAGGTGKDGAAMPLKHMEVYLPNVSDWSPMLPYAHRGRAPAAAMRHAHKYPAVAARARLLYILGGEISYDEKNRIVEVFDAMNNTWKELPNLPMGLTCAAAACSDHRIFISGGYQDGHIVTNRVWFLETDGNGNAVTNEWKDAPPMEFRRAAHALVNINGVLFAIGGVDADKKPTNRVECLLPGKSRWMEMPPLLDVRAHFACVAFQNKIFVMGGENKPYIPKSYENEESYYYWKHLSSVEIFDTESATEWEERFNMRQSKTRCAATVLNNRIFLAGGINETGILEAAAKYNPDTDKWHVITNMKFNRFNFGLVTLNLY